jgi:LPS-assembly protein
MQGRANTPAGEQDRLKRRGACERRKRGFLAALLPKSLSGTKNYAHISLCITGIVLCQQLMHAQVLSPEAHPVTHSDSASSSTADLPDAPAPHDVVYPNAQPVETESTDDTVNIVSDTQTKIGTVYTVEGNAVLTYKSYVLHADQVTYDAATGRTTAVGHLVLTGGPDKEDIRASHGELNMQTETGHFYDVVGSTEFQQPGSKTASATGNPFRFFGREVVKLGPEHYEVYGGSMTSCAMPHPDWTISATKMTVEDGKMRGTNSLFRLHGVPLFYLPYVTHPVDATGRQSGFLIPVLGESSTKGLIIGEEFYLVINRSMDMKVGVQYYSRRGWAQSAEFHYRGLGNDFLTASYNGLLDRGLPQVGAPPINQGGEDVVLSTRHDFNSNTRAAADVEYLSSYVYREAFTENFNQAVSSDVKSILYTTHAWDGMAVNVMADRYQSFESTIGGNEIRNFHAPQVEFDALEHRLGHSGFLWKASSSAALLRRVEGQPDPVIAGQLDTFRTNGVVSRIDFHPELSYPLHLGGWTFEPHGGVRDTYYSQSQMPIVGTDGLPVEAGTGLNRGDVEAGMEINAPVIERDFTTPWVESLFKRDLRHTIEPSIQYNYVTGIDNFLNVLRFDTTDIVSNTNELEYGLTQRLFLRQLKTHTCAADETPAPGATECGGGTSEWIRWRVAQKYFFDPSFGNAVTVGVRNVLATTLDFSGVAFVTGPRYVSPVISRIRVRTTQHMDVEWDLDYDTTGGRVAASNLYTDVHAGNWFGGLSHARLDAPGEIDSQPVSNFNQFRFLAGYGRPNKSGLSAAAGAGLDLLGGQLQYGTIQASYNWNCCGLNIEYSKFDLGPVRNENVYRFNFTLNGVGTAGNLRHAEQLF